ncbi:methylmalonate-semialdehyde dehydrogenase [Planctomycetota bacterium]|nr:methylmalonate-semialdehyde dehydrogenase [Planctomycetota bacterium]
MRRIGHWIGNREQPGQGDHAPVHDPATGAEIAQVALATPSEAAAGIAAAGEAFPAWAATPPLARSRILFRFRELLSAASDELALTISREHGKTVSDARGELVRGLEVVEFACGIPHLLKGEFSAEVGRGIDCHSQFQPLGVCAAISPFNFPAMVPLWTIPIALACGNTLVLKPSERDPSAALRLAGLLAESGLPPGVLNVINGDFRAAQVLLTDPAVQAVSFVGSTPTAEHVYRTACAAGKRVQALGGAKNHLVVMPDADLDQAASAVVGAAFGAAGERCMAVAMAVAVGDRTADALIARLRDRVAALRLGPGQTVPEPDLGPLITKAHRDRVAGLVATGVDEGAELVVDGRDWQVPGHSAGFFHGPCLFDRVEPRMRIWREEIFGPVLGVVRVPDFAAAMAVIAAHDHANGAAIFTRDGDTAREFARQVPAGMVGINVPIPVPMAFHSFGGARRSLLGPLHMYGTDGVRFFTRMQTITTRWPTGIRLGSEFTMPTLG